MRLDVQRTKQVKQESPAEEIPLRMANVDASVSDGLPSSARISMVLGRYLPTDWAVTGYLALTGMVSIFWGHNLTSRWEIPVLHLGLIVAVYYVVRFLHNARSRIGRFIRLLYLPTIITYFYEETGMMLHLFHQGWFDRQIIALERAVLGVSPTLWIQPWQNSLLNEWMMLGYFSYYILVGAVPLVLFIQRRERDAAQVVWAQALAFFISYIGFIVYPVQGPRFEFSGMYEHQLTGYLFVPLVDKIIETAAIHGGCMPSSHVAVALATLSYLYIYKKRWGIIGIPLVATLCAATVYGRFHYLSDAVVGLIIGVIAILISRRYPIRSWMVVNSLPQKLSRRGAS